MNGDWEILVGGWAYPSEKYESVGMMTFPIYGKIEEQKMFQTTNQFISGMWNVYISSNTLKFAMENRDVFLGGELINGLFPQVC